MTDDIGKANRMPAQRAVQDKLIKDGPIPYLRTVDEILDNATRKIYMMRDIQEKGLPTERRTEP